MREVRQAAGGTPEEEAMSGRQGTDEHVGCDGEPMNIANSVHQMRMRRYPSRWRAVLLRIALGRDTFDYMLRSIKADIRTPGAKLVDIVVRQDAREQRIEADWVKKIAQITYHLPRPKL
jgi:hypothetical protein